MDIIDIDRKTIVIGDFNAHSQRWGYKDKNPAGDAVEDFLCAKNLELVFNKEDHSTFIHYNGSSSNPDLLMVSTDIANNTCRTVIEDCGSGHRMVLAKISIPTKSANRPCSKTSWNFRKANWISFRKSLECSLDQNEINFNQHPDKIITTINNIIINTAKKYIPRGKQRGYRCFWNDSLTELKKNRDELRDRAQISNNPQITREWRRSCAILRKEITLAKQCAFNDFISKLNYKTDSLKAYKFINNLCSKTQSLLN